jgi:hypothetical protein
MLTVGDSQLRYCFSLSYHRLAKSRLSGKDFKISENLIICTLTRNIRTARGLLGRLFLLSPIEFYDTYPIKLRTYLIIWSDKVGF